MCFHHIIINQLFSSLISPMEAQFIFESPDLPDFVFLLSNLQQQTFESSEGGKTCKELGLKLLHVYLFIASNRKGILKGEGTEICVSVSDVLVEKAKLQKLRDKGALYLI